MGESLEVIMSGRSRIEMEEPQSPGSSGGVDRVEVSRGHVISTALLTNVAAGRQ